MRRTWTSRARRQISFILFTSVPLFNRASVLNSCTNSNWPHGSNATSREWSVGPHEPYWRTNTSFSPPPPRWDFRFQSEALSFGSHDGIQLYGSSASSNSRESGNWVRGNHLANHQYLASDGIGPYFSSPSNIFPEQQPTPPTIQEIKANDYGNSRRDAVVRPLSISPTYEGTSAGRDCGGSTSSRSDSSDYDSIAKSHSSHRNFSSRRCFMSKAIHPLYFPSETPTREAADNMAVFSEFDAIAPRKDKGRLSSASGSLDLSDISEPLESDLSGRSCHPSDNIRCGLCERFLSQRSPWSSRWIVRNGDMPVAAVLSCRHVFHAECLEQTTAKVRKSDPPCPICFKVEEENSPDQRVFTKLRSNFPRKHFSEDGPSKPWGCAQAGDCVEGALHSPTCNTVLNRNRFRKNLSTKGNSGREFPGKLWKSGSYSTQLFIGSSDHGAAGSSMTTAGSSSK
ncbi:RING/U-box superfamily protein [Abeliophyllum distichum]|uniref:RING/U-box superfamily protein n=1 Tax=Abeliophyllum distichum TaxID=126358 RepID=A0ABD1VZX3_9LAMI